MIFFTLIYQLKSLRALFSLREYPHHLISPFPRSLELDRIWGGFSAAWCSFYHQHSLVSKQDKKQKLQLAYNCQAIPMQEESNIQTHTYTYMMDILSHHLLHSLTRPQLARSFSRRHLSMISHGREANFILHSHTAVLSHIYFQRINS